MAEPAAEARRSAPGPGGLGGARVHVFVADLDEAVLVGDDRHHVETVRRLRPGDPLSASDGAGRWRPCRLGTGGRLEPTGAVVEEAPPRPPLALGMALTKGSRPELSVQKLTELGIDRIVVFTAARSVVRWEGERAARHLERLRRVAREAAMQCGRVRLPVVEGVAAFSEVADAPGAALARAGGGAPSLAHPTVLVGPEGGWAAEELARGLPGVGLGPLVLRAETAAIAAAALLAGLRSGLVAPRAQGEHAGPA
ncbi:MAG TPA: RsmE family RNA methyltransferase [Acidimicrobiales bacterium]|nr:RsmE family RNA methyltransferase [Acidimicrobiales bacterium]